MSVDVNYVAVLVAAVVNMVIGTVWYGPAFGKKWMALMKFTTEDMERGKSQGMKKLYVFAFIGSFLMAFVMYHFLSYTSGFLQESGATIGIQGAFWMWLGFIVPVTLSKVLWEGKSWTLWMLDSGYYLVVLLINGAILASWM